MNTGQVAQVESDAIVFVVASERGLLPCPANSKLDVAVECIGSDEAYEFDNIISISGQEDGSWLKFGLCLGKIGRVESSELVSARKYQLFAWEGSLQSFDNFNCGEFLLTAVKNIVY